MSESRSCDHCVRRAIFFFGTSAHCYVHETVALVPAQRSADLGDRDPEAATPAIGRTGL